ncbi:MAG: hypothetical protein R3E68_02435 [Burkholderiaceae bacterium]
MANDTDTDLPNDSLVVSVGAGPTHASGFTLNPDGTFSYTHDGSENFTGLVHLHRLDANGGVTDTGTVSIPCAPATDNDLVANDDSITVAVAAPPRCLIQQLHRSSRMTRTPIYPVTP